MKRILIPYLIVVLTNVQGQYSSYYNVDVNQNVNSHIYENINISGSVYEHKTIRSIDYGALQLANAQNEKNRIEKLIYADEKQRRISLEIATDPVKAYDYGFKVNYITKGKEAKQYGFKSFTASFREPNDALFVRAGAGRFENVSSNGITTEIIMYAPIYNKMKDTINVEEMAKLNDMKVGQLNGDSDNDSIFVHKKDINRANVFCVKGFKSTLIWEDDYQYTITDNFLSYDPFEGNGVMYFVKVRTYGDKDEVSFEDLEGRRYYLKQLIEKVISTARIFDMKY